jgi:hypothetical protein
MKRQKRKGDSASFVHSSQSKTSLFQAGHDILPDHPQTTNETVKSNRQTLSYASFLLRDMCHDDTAPILPAMASRDFVAPLLLGGQARVLPQSTDNVIHTPITTLNVHSLHPLNSAWASDLQEWQNFEQTKVRLHCPPSTQRHFHSTTLNLQNRSDVCASFSAVPSSAVLIDPPGFAHPQPVQVPNLASLPPNNCNLLQSESRAESGATMDNQWIKTHRPSKGTGWSGGPRSVHKRAGDDWRRDDGWVGDEGVDSYAAQVRVSRRGGSTAAALAPHQTLQAGGGAHTRHQSLHGAASGPLDRYRPPTAPPAGDSVQSLGPPSPAQPVGWPDADVQLRARLLPAGSPGPIPASGDSEQSDRGLPTRIGACDPGHSDRGLATRIGAGLGRPGPVRSSASSSAARGAPCQWSGGELVRPRPRRAGDSAWTGEGLLGPAADGRPSGGTRACPGGAAGGSAARGCGSSEGGGGGEGGGEGEGGCPPARDAAWWAAGPGAPGEGPMGTGCWDPADPFHDDWDGW